MVAVSGVSSAFDESKPLHPSSKPPLLISEAPTGPPFELVPPSAPIGGVFVSGLSPTHAARSAADVRTTKEIPRTTERRYQRLRMTRSIVATSLFTLLLLSACDEKK